MRIQWQKSSTSSSSLLLLSTITSYYEEALAKGEGSGSALVKQDGRALDHVNGEGRRCSRMVLFSSKAGAEPRAGLDELASTDAINAIVSLVDD